MFICIKCCGCGHEETTETPAGGFTISDPVCPNCGGNKVDMTLSSKPKPVPKIETK